MTFRFLSCLNVEPDELHVLWLGVVQYFMGSILWLLVYRCMRKTPKANMDDVWREVTENYHDNQTPTQLAVYMLTTWSTRVKFRNNLYCYTTRDRLAAARCKALT